MIDYKVSPFEPVRYLDVPSIGIQQIIDREMSFGSLRDLAIPGQASKLTPTERNSLADTLKEKYGGDNRVLRAALGVVTNPWVLMGFAISPGGVKAVQKTGRMFGLGKWVSTNAGPLSTFGALTSYQVLDGTPLAAIEDAVIRLKGTLHTGEQKIYAEELSKYFGAKGVTLKDGSPIETVADYMKHTAQKHGLSEKQFTDRVLRLGHVPQGVQEKEHAFNLVKTFSAAMDRAGRATPRNVVTVEPTFYKIIDGKRVQIKRKEYALLNAKKKSALDASERGVGAGLEGDDIVTKYIDVDRDIQKLNLVTEVKSSTPRIDQRVLEDMVQMYDLEPMIRSHRRIYEEHAVRLFYDEDVYRRMKNVDRGAAFEVDRNKVATLHRMLQGNTSNNGVWSVEGAMRKGASVWKAEGLDLLSSIMGPRSVIDGMNELPMDTLVRIIDSTVGDMTRRGTYVPRNTFAAAGEKWGGLARSEYGGTSIRSSENLGDLASINRLVPRSKFVTSLHPEDWKWMADTMEARGGNPKLIRMARQRQSDLAEDTVEALAAKGDDSIFRVWDGFEASRRYGKHMGDVWARFTPHRVGEGVQKKYNPAVYQEVFTLDKDIKASLGANMQKHFNVEVRHAADWEGVSNYKFKDSVVDMDFAKGPAGGITLGDMTSNWWQAMKNEGAQKTYRDVLLPYVKQQHPLKHSVIRAAHLRTAETMKWFADGPMGKWIEGFGEHGKNFTETLRSRAYGVGNAPPQYLSGQAAKWLYVGFLGANMSSVMLNLMQPLLHASAWNGLQNVLPAYKQAFAEMMSYAKERVKYGPIISDAKRAEIYEGAFSHMGAGQTPEAKQAMGDLLGMKPEVFANIDGVAYASPAARGTESKLKWATMTLPMKLFEKAELFNRLVTAHSVDNVYRKMGKFTSEWGEGQLDFFRRISDVRRGVAETQFGGTVSNMPTAFLGDGPFGGYLGNALSRQFLNFPTRSLTSFLVTGPSMGKGMKRSLRVPGLEHIEIPAVLGDFLRIMGTGALAYEIGKEVFRYDVSRGVGGQALFEVMDSGVVPPVVKLPIDLYKVIIGDELELAKSSLPALIPGGISAARAMGMLPSIASTFGSGVAKQMQRTFVGWDSPTPEGMVPVFKGDGTLINYEKPLTVVAKGLGVNLEDHPKAHELDGWLVKQRDQIVKLEGEYIQSVLSGNIGKAKALAAEFEKRFGMPMVISKSQWRSRLRNLEVSRTERILDRIPSEYKGLYQEAVRELAPRMGMPSEDVVMGASTSRKRSDLFDRPETVTLSPEAIAEIRRSLQQQEQDGAPVEEQGFNPFKSWAK